MYKYLLKRVHQTYQEYMVCWIRKNLRKGTVVYLKGSSPNKLWKIVKKFKPESVREMKKNEVNIIEEVYFKLCSKNFNNAAKVMLFCCTWESKNAISKVRYWLKHGLENDGDYTANREISGALLGPYEKVPVEHLMYAFNLLDEAAKRRDFHRNE